MRPGPGRSASSGFTRPAACGGTASGFTSGPPMDTYGYSDFGSGPGWYWDVTNPDPDW